MKLQTQITLQKEKYNPIDYTSNLLLLGSCFSNNIGNKLAYYKFQSSQNPFGILFHPKAIETCITNAINKKEYTAAAVFYLNERWHCFDAHSDLSAIDKNKLLANLNSASNLTFQQLHSSTHIIITLGTAWIYKFIETDAIVTNCHKVQQKKFLKELMSVDEITESLEKIISLIRLVNKKTSIVFTISPVRHLKDGFIENQQSKAHLITAIHQIVEPRKNSYYFPSYEIMMDELRDYRFYAEDMIHPNSTAIDYIWSKFSEAWISEAATKTMQEVASIQNGLTHRPFNPNSVQHQQFLDKLNQKIELLKKEHPSIQF
ncbi:MAG: GSCFA domain-containing protein [Flavobacteriaceae bacterium]|nr:GSCFA domain-containing protein [Flavobacteriaceae bacterium]